MGGSGEVRRKMRNKKRKMRGKRRRERQGQSKGDVGMEG